MPEGQASGVQRQAPIPLVRKAISRVAHDGMAVIGELHANLMLSARKGPNLQ